MQPCCRVWKISRGGWTLSIEQQTHKEVGAVLDGEKGLLMDHLTLKDPLGVQVLLLTVIKIEALPKQLM